MAESDCTWKEEERGDEISIYSRTCHKEHLLLANERNPNFEIRPEISKFVFCFCCGSEIKWEIKEKQAKDQAI